MKNFLRTLSIGGLLFAVTSPALAHIPPMPPMHSKHLMTANASISGGGLGYINGTECTVTITGTIGPDVNLDPAHVALGHTAVGHADYATLHLVNSGSSLCNGKTLDVTLYADGDFEITGQTGLSACFPGAVFSPVPGFATLTLNPPDIEATIATMPFGGCFLAGELFAGSATIVTHP